MSNSGYLWWMKRVSLSFLAMAMGACGDARGDFGTDISGDADGSVSAALQPACGAGLGEVCSEPCDGDGDCAAPEVACGSDTCTLDEEVCCQYDANDTLNPVYSFACVPLLVDGAGRPAAASDCSISIDRKISCDEPSDCRTDEICCSNDNQGGTEFECTPPASCPGSFLGPGSTTPLCGSPAATAFSPCPAALRCLPMADAPGYSNCRP